MNKKEARLRRARTKLTLAAILGMTDAMQQSSVSGLDISQKRGREQLGKIRRWLDCCWDDLKLGKKSAETAIDLVNRIDAETVRAAPEGMDVLEKLCAIWIMIGMVLDDAVKQYAPARNGRPWKYLASTVNTWAAMMLENLDGDMAEIVGGEMAEAAWGVLLDRPDDYFGDL